MSLSLQALTKKAETIVARFDEVTPALAQQLDALKLQAEAEGIEAASAECKAIEVELVRRRLDPNARPAKDARGR